MAPGSPETETEIKFALAREPGREPGRAAFGNGDIALVAPLAAHTGTGIVNAATMARHLAIADVLQRGLLGGSILRVPRA